MYAAGDHSAAQADVCAQPATPQPQHVGGRGPGCSQPPRRLSGLKESWRHAAGSQQVTVTLQAFLLCVILITHSAQLFCCAQMTKRFLLQVVNPCNDLTYGNGDLVCCNSPETTAHLMVSDVKQQSFKLLLPQKQVSQQSSSQH